MLELLLTQVTGAGSAGCANICSARLSPRSLAAPLPRFSAPLPGINWPRGLLDPPREVPGSSPAQIVVVAKGGANSIAHRAGVPSWHGTPGLAELGVSITGSLLLLGFSLECPAPVPVPLSGASWEPAMAAGGGQPSARCSH